MSGKKSKFLAFRAEMKFSRIRPRAEPIWKSFSSSYGTSQLGSDSSPLYTKLVQCCILLVVHNIWCSFSFSIQLWWYVVKERPELLVHSIRYHLTKKSLYFYWYDVLYECVWERRSNFVSKKQHVPDVRAVIARFTRFWIEFSVPIYQSLA